MIGATRSQNTSCVTTTKVMLLRYLLTHGDEGTYRMANTATEGARTAQLVAEVMSILMVNHAQSPMAQRLHERTRLAPEQATEEMCLWRGFRFQP